MMWIMIKPDIEEQYDRYLDQEYLSINNKIVSKTCQSYNPAINPMCRSCRFYTTRYQNTKFGNACPIWFKSFGNELRKFIKKMVDDNLIFTEKTIEIWNKRQVNIPVSDRFKSRLVHPSMPKERRKDGLFTVEMNK